MEPVANPEFVPSVDIVGKKDDCCLPQSELFVPNFGLPFLSEDTHVNAAAILPPSDIDVLLLKICAAFESNL